MRCRPALPLRRVLSRPFATSSWCFASHDSAANHPRGGTLLTRKLLACLPLIRHNAAKCFVVRPRSKLHFRRGSLTLHCSLWLHPTTALRALLYFEAPEKKRLESTLQIARRADPTVLVRRRIPRFGLSLARKIQRLFPDSPHALPGQSLQWPMIGLRNCLCFRLRSTAVRIFFQTFTTRGIPSNCS